MTPFPRSANSNRADLAVVELPGCLVITGKGGVDRSAASAIVTPTPEAVLEPARAPAGAPDLSAEGAKNKGIAFQIAHLKCPSCVNPGSPMPQFSALGLKRLTQLAIFLEASKGGK